MLRYSFGIINWRTEEIKKIDRKTRKMLTMYKMHHPNLTKTSYMLRGKEGDDWYKSKWHIKQK